jgi:hypothetical protein
VGSCEQGGCHGRGFIKGEEMGQRKGISSLSERGNVVHLSIWDRWRSFCARRGNNERPGS